MESINSAVRSSLTFVVLNHLANYKQAAKRILGTDAPNFQESLILGAALSILYDATNLAFAPQKQQSSLGSRNIGLLTNDQLNNTVHFVAFHLSVFLVLQVVNRICGFKISNAYLGFFLGLDCAQLILLSLIQKHMTRAVIGSVWK